MLRSVLNQTKDQPQLILAHFPIDNSLALVKRSSFIDKNAVISVGSEHQVKGGSKVYTAKIIEIGDDEAIKIAEDKFHAADDENEVSKESDDDQRTLGQDASIIEAENNSCSVVQESAFPTEMALDKKGNKRKQQQEGNGKKRPKTHTVKNGKSEKGKSKKKKEPGSIITITDHNDKVADKDAKVCNERDTSNGTTSKPDVEKKKEFLENEFITVDGNSFSSSSDSLTRELFFDDLEARVIKTEKLLEEAIVRISALEENIKLSYQSTDLQPHHSSDSLLTGGETYSFLDDDDEVPALPKSVLPQSLQPVVTPQPQYSYMPAAPMYSQQIGRADHQFYNHPYQSSPLQPVQLSSYYTSPPNTSQMTPPMPSAVPKCLPIHGRKKKMSTSCLPSIEINKENLSPCDIILKKYSSLHNERGIGTLAVKLASESFFGDDVLRKCTVMGYRDCPALPSKELNELKQVLFSLFPKYWNNLSEFESKIWNVCTNSIGQLCKRLRVE